MHKNIIIGIIFLISGILIVPTTYANESSKLIAIRKKLALRKQILEKNTISSENQNSSQEKNITIGNNIDNKINYGKIEQTWLDWNNDLRKELGLSGYTIDTRLSTTALAWSQQAKVLKNITHKRTKEDSYYNYKGIERWFANRGITFKNINRVTFSESIGYGGYSCKSDDCTDILIKSIRSTYDMYLREKNKKSRPHYNALINKHFRVMGLGVVVDEQAKTYYLTVHYGTEVIE